MVLPWQKHRRETAEVHAKLAEETLQVDQARLRTLEAAVDQQYSRANSDRLMQQVRQNGWTELLQQAWKGRAV